MMSTTTKNIQHIRIKLDHGGEIECPIGTPVEQILPGAQNDQGLPYLAALVNHDVCSLSYPLEMNAHVSFLTFADREGLRVYRRTLGFVLAKAVRDTFPEVRFSIEHSLGSGYYCRFDSHDKDTISPSQLATLKEHMQHLVEADIPITRHSVSFEEAYRKLEEERQFDKLNLLRFRNPPKVTLFRCEDFDDLFLGVMASRTGVLTHFDLLPYEMGFVLQFPELHKKGLVVSPYQEQPHLFNIFKEHKRWGNMIGINTVGDLNERIANQKLTELVRISEALHEKKYSQIADQVAAKKGVKYIFIAGPSSAGKTTSSKRLQVHLQVNGLRPVTLECDNYFVDRALTPKTETGEYDFEHVEALDLDLFNTHLERLSQGEEIQVPKFDFHEGKRIPGHPLKLEEDQVAIIEGIHCLNPRLSEGIPEEQKFGIYINCITQLKLDYNNRISTTDSRLIRRMVRDNQFRGHSARRTLQMWHNVRRGEKKWIFPFQQHAEATFNSSLDYELAIFKPFVRPLLAEVKPFHQEYAEAKRLLAFMEMVITASPDAIPPYSILREFIGKSHFEY